MRRSLLWAISISFLMLAILDIVFAFSVEEIAGKFRKRYEKVKNFSADFEQTTFVASRKRFARGKLSFQKPNLLRLEYFDPDNPEHTTQLIVSDGKVRWSYTPLISQVMKTELVQDGSSMELLPGFGRSLENIEKNYSVSLVEDKLAEKSGVHVVELIPRSLVAGSEPMFDSLRVWIRDEDSVPIRFVYKDQKNEMTFILSFKDVEIDKNLDESTFRFEVPEGVQVITVPSQ